ncbi:MAG: carboxypeptidase-like regulatory domain-containing protein [Desulfobaccales bacterium]
MCIFGIASPIVGASVQLSTPENGVLVTKPTDAAGTFTVKTKVNNCTLSVGFYPQAWSVTIDAHGLGIPAAKTCSASVDFICCCKQCVQSIIKTCKLMYKFCC